MTFRSNASIVVLGLVSALSFNTALFAASADAQREKETSGVTPDKTNTSAGEAQRTGTGEGRATPAEKAPIKREGH